jgi:pyruvate dehydrogenase E2 component (dihydrolipoamide acetyltransferase)/2-oxoglutarate dehydrogenase E2 component (dihydrolipoamide succinyltransferase)
MPQLGMSQDTGKIVSWLKSPGDAVSKGDILFEVETDKATVEVEAQAKGYLNGVTTAEGEEAAVGAVIAVISETPEALDHPATSNTAGNGAVDETDDLPDGHSVTMPQLGMAQDTGLLVSWLKAPGDQIAASDVLFEVETDKSTMEVEAGRDGFLAATLANAGEEVPVGATVAVISGDKPANPIARSARQSSKPEPSQPQNKAADQAKEAASSVGHVDTSNTPRQPSVAPNIAGRILASPKARRLALEEGLDLNRLVKAGHPQPFHVRDLDTLRAMGAPETAAHAGPASRRLVANIDRDGLGEFAEWAQKTHGLEDADAILCGLAAASMARPGPIRLERFGLEKTYEPGKSRALTAVVESDAAPVLIVRDLRHSRVQSVELGAEDVPVLTLMQSGSGLAITLETSAAHLDASSAIQLLEDFAGKVEQPLRHLL